MPPTAEGFQIVLAGAVGMPEVEQSAADWLASTIENEPGHSAWNTRYSRFAEVSFERRVGLEKGPRGFLCRELKLLADRWSGLKLHRIAAAAEQRLDPREKGNRGSRNGDCTKKSAPRKVRCIKIRHTQSFTHLECLAIFLCQRRRLKAKLPLNTSLLRPFRTERFSIVPGKL